MPAVPPFILLNREFGPLFDGIFRGKSQFPLDGRYPPSFPRSVAFSSSLAGGAGSAFHNLLDLSIGRNARKSFQETKNRRSVLSARIRESIFRNFSGVFLISLPVLVIVFGGLFRLVQIPLNGWAAGVPRRNGAFLPSRCSSFWFSAFFTPFGPAVLRLCQSQDRSRRGNVLRSGRPKIRSLFLGPAFHQSLDPFPYGGASCSPC